MPREAKPYEERGWYVSRPLGQYIRLCRVEEGMTEAKRLLRLKLAELEEQREQLGGRLAPNLSVTELFVLFLEDTEATKSKAAFKDYQRWCTEFAKVHGNRPARSITKAEANDFKLALMNAVYVVGKQPPRPYKPKSVNHALIALRRAFNWAIKTDRLPPGRNPFARVELLHCEGRQRVATEEEYQALLAHCTDDAFRDVLVAMRYTSSRPQDIYSLTWSMVDWDGAMWRLTEHKGRRTARHPKPRIIGMNDDVRQVLLRRREQFGDSGHVFLNADGRPWKKDALGLRMRRLRKRAGVEPDERGEQFVLYTNRHTFLTVGGDTPTVSQSGLTRVAGHTNPVTTEKYVHAAHRAIAEDGRRIAAQLKPSAPASGG
jgi:integrase